MFLIVVCVFVFFFKQKTAYEMRISDWSSDVCSSDLRLSGGVGGPVGLIAHMIGLEEAEKVRCGRQIGPLEHRAVRHKGAAGMRFFPFGDEVAAIGALAGHGGIFGIVGRRRQEIRAPAAKDEVEARRSEERRVGKEGVSTCRSRWSA